MTVGLIRASHIGPTIAVTAFTSALALGTGRGLGVVAVAAAVLSGQLVVGWSNDYIDRDRDARAGRVDKPIPAGAVSAWAVRDGSIVAAVCCVPLSMLSGWRAGVVHLGAVGVAVVYNARLKLTMFSVVPYIVAFGSLPAFVSLGARGHRLPPASSVIAAALLAAGAHFVNTLPDVSADRVTGVRGLPQRLGPTTSLVVGAMLLGGASAVVALTTEEPLGITGWMVAAVAALAVVSVLAAAATGRTRLAWTLSLGAAASTVTLYLVCGERLG